jgi:hypothetical protein
MAELQLNPTDIDIDLDLHQWVRYPIENHADT